MQCNQVEREMSQMFEGTLEPEIDAALREHLARCVSCRDALGQLQRLPEVMQTWRPIEPTIEMYNHLQNRLHPSPIQRWQGLNWPWKAAVCGMVLLAVGIGFGAFNIWWNVQTTNSQIKRYATKHRIAQSGTLTLTSLASARPAVGVEQWIAYQILQGSKFQKGLIFGNSWEWSDEPIDLAEQLSDVPITRAEAEREMPFTVIVPSYLHPGYLLDGMRRLGKKEALHLVYTDGIDMISVFEQQFSEKYRLNDAILQQHAIQQKDGNAETVVLSWIVGDVSFSLVGEGSMPKLIKIVERLRREVEDTEKLGDVEIEVL